MRNACLGNQIGAEGARALAESLKVNQTVTKIVLSSECESGDSEDMWRKL